MDLSGKFGRCEEGTVVFIKGKYKGRSLEDIARTKPDYLQWCSGTTTSTTRSGSSRRP